MTEGKLIYYDENFFRQFGKMRDLLDAEDWPALYRHLLDNFSIIFKTAQYYAKQSQSGTVKAFEEADDDIKRELMRPLSWRQYRLIGSSFSPWKEEEELVISSLWDFLHDSGRIYEKKVMSPSEVAGASIVLENIFVCLSHRCSPLPEGK